MKKMQNMDRHGDIAHDLQCAYEKLNELIDAVNELQEELMVEKKFTSAIMHELRQLEANTPQEPFDKNWDGINGIMGEIRGETIIIPPKKESKPSFREVLEKNIDPDKNRPAYSFREALEYELDGWEGTQFDSVDGNKMIVDAIMDLVEEYYGG